MEDQKISLETAKLAKEKEFKVGVGTYYVRYNKTRKHENPSFNMKKGSIEIEPGYFENNGLGDLSNPNYTCYARPSQSLLQKWLRETQDKHVQIENCNNPTKGKWIYEIARLSGGMLYLWHKETSPQYDTYEEALEVGLRHALNHIK